MACKKVALAQIDGILKINKMNYHLDSIEWLFISFQHHQLWHHVNRQIYKYIHSQVNA